MRRLARYSTSFKTWKGVIFWHVQIDTTDYSVSFFPEESGHITSVCTTFGRHPTRTTILWRHFGQWASEEAASNLVLSRRGELVAGFSLPKARVRSQELIWDLWWAEWNWNTFSSSTSVCALSVIFPPTIEFIHLPSGWQATHWRPHIRDALSFHLKIIQYAHWHVWWAWFCILKKGGNFKQR